MKNGLILFVLAFCGMSLFATDPTFSYWSASRRDIIVDGGGTAISNIAVVVDAGCPIVPWKVEVSGSTKTTTSDTTVFTPTNYVGTMTGVHTNWFTVASTNSVNGFVLTNEVATSTITNRFTSLRGLDVSAGDIVATNGVSETVSAGSSVTAGGTLAISDGTGTSWTTLDITSGSVGSTNVFDASKIAFGGTLRLTATQAERLKLRVTYLKLGK
jgi:hypothetical protein